MPVETFSETPEQHEIDATTHAVYGFTVELHPNGMSSYGTDKQIILSKDRLMHEFDQFRIALRNNPHIIEDDSFAEALIEHIVQGIKTDITLLKNYSHRVDVSTTPYVAAFESSLDELQTELSVWIAEYRRYVRLEHPSSGVRNDSRLLDFKQSHPYNFFGICDTHDIICNTLEKHIKQHTPSND